MQQQEGYPVRFSVDYPDRSLDRPSTAFRIFMAIPILVVLGAVSSGGSWDWSNGNGNAQSAAAGAGGLLFLGPLLLPGDRLRPGPGHRPLPTVPLAA